MEGKSKYDPFWQSEHEILQKLVKQAKEEGKSEDSFAAIKFYGERQPKSWTGLVAIYNGRLIQENARVHLKSIARILISTAIVTPGWEFKIRMNKENLLKISGKKLSKKQI
jgi:hypothetical protein